MLYKKPLQIKRTLFFSTNRLSYVPPSYPSLSQRHSAYSGQICPPVPPHLPENHESLPEEKTSFCHHFRICSFLQPHFGRGGKPPEGLAFLGTPGSGRAFNFRHKRRSAFTVLQNSGTHGFPFGYGALRCAVLPCNPSPTQLTFGRTGCIWRLFIWHLHTIRVVSGGRVSLRHYACLYTSLQSRHSPLPCARYSFGKTSLHLPWQKRIVQ